MMLSLSAVSAACIERSLVVADVTEVSSSAWKALLCCLTSAITSAVSSASDARVLAAERFA